MHVFRVENVEESSESDLKRARVDVQEDAAHAEAVAPVVVGLDFAHPPVCVFSCTHPWSTPIRPRVHPTSAVDPLNFTKGVCFSCDGRRLLVPSDDGRVRVLNVPEQVSKYVFAQYFWRVLLWHLLFAVFIMLQTPHATGGHTITPPPL